MRLDKIVLGLALAGFVFACATASASMFRPDTDEDGIEDLADNCTEVANPQQVDTDGDGFGNACDTDLNGSHHSDDMDYHLFKRSFGLAVGHASYNPAADFTEDGIVGAPDYSIFVIARKAGAVPGPSGLRDPYSGAVEVDTDGDGAFDSVDNCSLLDNPSQIDSNTDGYGDRCDPDVDNNGLVKKKDYRLWAPSYGTMVGDDKYLPEYDFDSDGLIGISDLGIFRDFLRRAPGPSALVPLP